MAIEIVDLPIKMVIFHSKLLVSITGNPNILWENLWFPLKIFPTKPIHWKWDIAGYTAVEDIPLTGHVLTKQRGYWLQ